MCLFYPKTSLLAPDVGQFSNVNNYVSDQLIVLTNTGVVSFFYIALS
jgi:hypothetical protein